MELHLRGTQLGELSWAPRDGDISGVNTHPQAVPATLFTVIAALAVGNGVLIILLSASRMLYGMADQKVLHGSLAAVHPTRHTPWVAAVAVTSP